MIKIRSYQKKDKIRLQELLSLNTPQFFAHEEAEQFSQFLENEIEDYFVVEMEDCIVGAGGINYWPAQQTARFSWDFIHPEYQRRGIGKWLINHRIAEIKKHAFIKMIEVRTSQLVFPFYEKAGFCIIKTQRDFWAPGFDLVHLQLNLSS